MKQPETTCLRWKLRQASMKLIIIVILAMLVASCASKTGEAGTEAEKRQFVTEKNPVDIIVIQKGPFQKELVSNGKLKARRKSMLKFSAADELLQLNVKNGDYVKEGQVIASLNSERSVQQLEQAKANLEKARFELQDLLIGLNYSLDDSASIPKKTYDMACIQSGYTSARSQLETAQYELRSRKLNAPFSGMIAGLKYKVYEHVGPGTEFCTLIDNSSFEVEFPVMESELEDVSSGKEVKIIPFSMKDKTFTGRITEINPMVDENGMIQVKATLNQSGQLMDGMNVQVLVENAVTNQLVVPKAAVVLRDNQEVLFRIINGKAYWTYVQTVHENSDSYAVIANADKGAELAPGDTVIISGNLNLAHESEVEVR